MPTFDGGHYFLTALVPIRTDDVDDGLAVTSPVHALRKRLDMLPTAAATPIHRVGQCPFTRNTLNHFARLVIIDDVAYNGREPGNKLSSLFANLTVAQPQDHLSCPFLLWAVDFDAESGADAERDRYLAELWNTMGGEIRDIFGFCQGFHGRVTDAASFAKYIADCQLETTMSYNDYYVGSVDDLLIKPAQKYLRVAGAVAAVIVLGFIGILCLVGSALFAQSWISPFWHAVILALLCAVGVGFVLITAYMTILMAGSRPFAAAPDSNLPTVLKALHLQRAFTRFAIDNQMTTASSSAASAQKLYDDFAKFIAVNKPSDLGGPTQPPGVVGI